MPCLPQLKGSLWLSRASCRKHGRVDSLKHHELRAFLSELNESVAPKVRSTRSYGTVRIAPLASVIP